jgi:predicted RNase H-like nuclease
LVVKDWRSNVRICNLETADFAALVNAIKPDQLTNILHLLTRALAKVPRGVRAISRPAFYMNSSVFAVLMRTAMEKSNNALAIQSAIDQFGVPTQWMTFLGVPLRQVDAILNTEAVVN